MSLLNEFNVIGREESVGAVHFPRSPPPAWIQLLNVGDHLINVESQLTVVLWMDAQRKEPVDECEKFHTRV